MGPKKRVPIPLGIKRKMLLYCRHECCLCDVKVSGKREKSFHHINQDPSDNRFENLIVLCPNCHARADRGDFSEEHLKTIRDAKIRRLNIREFVEAKTKPEVEFKAVFSMELKNLCKCLDGERDYQEVNDLVDDLIMLVKERIERWDIPSVKFATENLFMKLYKRSEQEGFCELYTIFEDLFSYAYSQRKHILGSMIHVLNLILFGSWVPKYDIERGEKAAKMMLRLGMDFLARDLSISKACLAAIDNLAGDMFEPEILSKEILLGAHAFLKASKNPELHNFVEKLVDWVRVNDQYAWDDEYCTYLVDSIQYAKCEQEKYEIHTEAFKKTYLLPALEQNIDKQVEDFVDFLVESEFEGREDMEFHTNFTVELLARLILSYESVRPTISEEIRRKAKEKNSNFVIKEFDRLIANSNLLKKIYRGSEMITTFDELIRFLETSSDIENLGVGITTYSLAMIVFTRKLDKEAEKMLMNIAEKYGIQEDFEITDQGIQFLMDHLVYLGKNKNDMRKLIDFLKEVNSKFGVKSFSTSITFELRDMGKTLKH